jgi:hypothetical protein
MGRRGPGCAVHHASLPSHAAHRGPKTPRYGHASRPEPIVGGWMACPGPLPVVFPRSQHAAVTGDTVPPPDHKAWMPRSRRWNSMKAASTS